MTLEEALKEIERLNKVVAEMNVAQYHYLQKISNTDDHLRAYRAIAENLASAINKK